MVGSNHIVAALNAPWIRVLLSFLAGSAFTVLVIGWGTTSTIQPDFAIAAISALATLAAVVVALVMSERQIVVAREAAHSERTTALELHTLEEGIKAAADNRRSVQLAHALSRELVFANRDLKVFLANINPSRFEGRWGPAEAREFLSHKPLGDLELMQRFCDKLDGFDDKVAFAITTVLAGWQWYNRSPGMTFEEFASLGPDRLRRNVMIRATQGCELLLSVQKLNNTLVDLCTNHPDLKWDKVDESPPELVEGLRYLAPYMNHALARGDGARATGPAHARDLTASTDS